MAERIVSPGVFTRESDLSFLPQAIGAIGAAIVGPTKKGPAFVPTQITSFQDFEQVFGGMDDRFYTPNTVEQYLKSAGVVTVVRILGLGGYKHDNLRLNVHSSSVATQSLAVLAPSRGNGGTSFAGSNITLNNPISGSVQSWDSFELNVVPVGAATESYALSFNSSSANYITKVLSQDPQSTRSGNSNSSVYVYKVWTHTGNSTTYDSFSSASLDSKTPREK